MGEQIRFENKQSLAIIKGSDVKKKLQKWT